jgi:photosystem II stability/assembly factor-like uncharacterized protein
MKYLSFPVVLLSLVAGPIVPSLAADSAWVPAGPPGGTTSQLVLHPRNPNILWAATQTAGVFKSVNGGASWFPSREGLASSEIQALAVAPSDPDILYAATRNVLSNGPGNIFRSSDGGRTWTAGARRAVNALVVDPRDPRTIYVGAAGVFKSVDGGVTWRRTGRNASILALVFDPKDPKVLYAAGEDGVARSDDGGASWTSLSHGIVDDTIASLVIHPKNPRRMWALGIRSQRVYRTVDGGALWRRSGRLLGGGYLRTLALAPAAGRSLPILWVGAQDGAFRSLDGGVTWEDASPDLHHRWIESLLVHPGRPGVLWAASPSSDRLDHALGIFKSVDGGASWRASSRGLLALPVFALAFDPVTPGTLWAGSPYAGVLRSADGGATWAERNGNLELQEGQVSDLAVDPRAPETVWAASLRGVFVTDDGGAIWEERNEGLVDESGSVASVHVLRLAHANPSVAYAGASVAVGSRLYKTIDAGAHWSQPASLSPSNVIADVLVDPRDPDVVVVAANDFDLEEGALWISRDGGATWKAAPRDDASYLWSLAIDPHNPDVLYAGGHGGIFRSADGGRTWQRVADLQVADHPDLVVSPTGAVWASTRTGVYWSSDGLSGWTAAPGVERFFVQGIEADPHDPGSVLAAALGGVFRHEED